MSKLVWDETGKREFEAGVSEVALYVMDADGSYKNGVAWNGVTGITESPSGAEKTDLWADNSKYLSMRSAEDLGATLEAYMAPDEFSECDGMAEVATGVTIGQQSRTRFGLVYKTQIGNDVLDTAYGYKLHILYGVSAAPSERSYQTINDSPEAITFSWELTTTPANVTGHKATALLTVDSTRVNAEKLATLEKKLYGDTTTQPTLLTPDEVIAIINGTSTST